MSKISLFEIATLQSLGKVSLKRSIGQIMDRLEGDAVDVVPIGADNLEQKKTLPVLTIGKKIHTDPNYRLIIATAIHSRCTLVSSDKKFPSYRRLGLLTLGQIAG